jgi:hypothetical protein
MQDVFQGPGLVRSHDKAPCLAPLPQGYDVQLFTDSREKLGSALGHDVSHQSAHKPDRKPPQREIAETPKQEKSQGMDIGLSL